MPKLNIQEGDRFGRLEVLFECARSDSNKRRMLCQCDCGTQKILLLTTLRTGRAKSCGCYQKECRGKSSVIHGMARKGKVSSEFNIWAAMKDRCYNTNNHAYSRYGGRGIKVCNRWLESFQNFYEDMGPRPSSNYSIDRKDVNGNYELSNCRWADNYVQAGNTRSNRVIEYNGYQLILNEWARKLNVSRERISSLVRYTNRNWTEAIAYIVEKDNISL